MNRVKKAAIRAQYEAKLLELLLDYCQESQSNMHDIGIRLCNQRSGIEGVGYLKRVEIYSVKPEMEKH